MARSKPATQRARARGPQERALPFGSQQRQTLSSSTPVNLGAQPAQPPMSSIDQRLDPSAFRTVVHHVSTADLRADGPSAGTSYQFNDGQHRPGGLGSSYSPIGQPRDNLGGGRS